MSTFYHLCECKCGKKRIRSLEYEMLKHLIDNPEFLCASCESTYTYKGYEELIADKKINEDKREHIEPKKKKPYLTFDNLLKLRIIDKHGMPMRSQYRSQYGNYFYPISYIKDALQLAIDMEDDILIKNILNKHHEEIRESVLKQIAKKRKKYLKKFLM